MKNISRYELIDEIGSGGTGIVYKAFDPVLNKTFALKVLNTTNADDSGWIRFQKEAKTLCDLEHPSIPEIYNFDINEDDEPYMVMELIDGVSLKEYLKKRGVLSLEESLKIILQICDSLTYAHSQKVLHRDIKPANTILVNTESYDHLKVMLIDFGLAKLDSRNMQDMTQTGVIIGTPPYMSPEQIKGEEMDERSDLYSLGCLIFELLTGEKPFIGATPMKTIAMHLADPAPKLIEKNHDGNYSNELESIIAKTLSKSKDDRYQTIADLKTAFLNLQESELVTTTDSEVIEEPEQKKISSNFIKPALVAIVFTSLAVTVFIIQFSKHSKVEDSMTTTSRIIVEPLIATEMEKPESGAVSNYVHLVKKEKPGDEEKEQTIFKKNNCHLNVSKSRKLSELQATPDFTDENLSSILNSKELPESCSRWNLSGSKITGSALKLLKSRKISKLDISETNLNSEDLKRLDTKNLFFLNISDTKVSDEGMKWISQQKKLRKLKLMNCDYVTNNGFGYLSNLKNLRELTISGDKINAQTLLLVSKIDSLESIIIPYAKLNGGFLRPLSKLPNLKNLGLNHSKLTELAVKDLERFKQLRRVGISHTNMKAKDVARLRSVLPRCQISIRSMNRRGENRLKMTEEKLLNKNSPEYLLY